MIKAGQRAPFSKSILKLGFWVNQSLVRHILKGVAYVVLRGRGTDRGQAQTEREDHGHIHYSLEGGMIPVWVMRAMSGLGKRERM